MAVEQVQCWKCGQPRPVIESPCPYCSSGLRPTPGVHQTWQGRQMFAAPPGPREPKTRAERRRWIGALLVVAIVFTIGWMVFPH